MLRQSITLILAVTCAVAAPKAVKTATGPVAGVASSDGMVISYKGIPYAAPPVGELRWRAPQPAKRWSGVLKADHFGSSCIQAPNTPFGPYTSEFLYIAPVSEDCLYLNVWAPRAARKAPVLVFIHGGAFNSGSGDVPVYDGEPLARTGLIVVTINYRVGVLGFLAHPELTAESAHHSSGNYGLLDQIAALQWVKANIRAFGGDAAHVAIAGQSAGALSVEALIASPLAKGLFSAAIADSGIGGRVWPLRSLAEGEKWGSNIAQMLKASSIKELRALPAGDLLPKGRNFGTFGLVMDGWALTGNPKTLSEQGKDNDVPVITGYQADDGGAGTGANMGEEFAKLYPGGTKEAQKAAARDRARVGAYLWALKRAASHKSGVYTYFFDRAIPWPQHPEYGAFHTGEIPYCFGTLKTLDRPWEPVDFQVSQMMMAFWKNMAAKGDPNGGAAPRWAPVGAASPVTMRLGAQSGMMPVADRERLEFWKRYFAAPGR